MSEREILLSLLASLSLCDHIGDVAADVFKALELLGMDVSEEVESLDDVGRWLYRTYGVKTLYGTDFED